MKAGIFHVPYLQPKRSPRQVFDYSVEIAREADQAGFADFMIGEHATQAWESVPNPEIVIGACARETEQLRFAPMAHLLGLHNPGSLAIQVGWLSQVLEGRYFLGVGPGAYPRDAILRGQPEDLSEARPRRDEALKIMQQVWERKPFHFEGEYFTGGFPEEASDSDDPGSEYHMMPDFSPWQGAENLEIAMTALSFNSQSMKYAGTQDFSPISFFGGLAGGKSHWKMFEEGQVESGFAPDRQRFRICRDIVVADTDAEAKRIALEGGLGECWEKYLVPVYKEFKILQGYIDDSGTGIDMSSLDMDWIAEHVWICGSPETVTRKLQAMNEAVGGFGQIVMNTHDYIDDPKPWVESMHRLTSEVIPNITDVAA
ncbi:LLM class flavin-dependent oxidoreductase [Pseudonocardia xishanensis]|uniref:LLM class flavin-dependent oxidoreductase n=1 Tax=Pseudonocardia xishanensis TaxID=630995 RepID=A0ABP8RC52_9PSEU